MKVIPWLNTWMCFERHYTYQVQDWIQLKSNKPAKSGLYHQSILELKYVQCINIKI